MDRCWLCDCVFGTKDRNGVGHLQTFQGYTVDFRLQQFRKVPLDTLPEFIDFDSPEGRHLCTAMHDAAIRQLT